MTEHGPWLDRDSEPWHGCFPGLGEVFVDATGGVRVQAEPGTEDAGLRERALELGWGEPLSLVRRGFRCTGAAAVVAPDGGCLLVAADPHDAAIVLLELSEAGWLLLADRTTPLRWADGRLQAFERQAPLLVSDRRAGKAGVAGTPVRADTDAVAVEVPRARGPVEVRAVLSASHRRVDEPVLRPVGGLERFERATWLLLGGVFAPDPEPEPAAAMAEHVRLAALPIAHWGLEPNDPEVLREGRDAVLEWWQGLG